MRELTKTEEIVMKTIWEMDGIVTLSGVVKILDVERSDKGWKPQTISTYFRKLVEKGYLHMNRQGKTYSYDILIKEKEYRDYLVRDILDRYFHGNKKAFIADIKEK